MHRYKNSQERFAFFLLTGILAVTAVLNPEEAAAQERLEEIVVTAQRREESIKEVPISLETFGGTELTLQGFRTMEDLSNFSPTVEIDIRVQDQDVSIRGLGTTGNNLGLEQAVPIFVDGIHFGRTSMVNSAFFDLERVEVLRGPQPVAFGQNATAGAFSLVTRKPSDTWEGDATVEFGNFGRKTFEGGIGGPLSDTWAIRVAGQYDALDGYIKDIVTGSDFPEETASGGRVTLQWKPSDRFTATLKGEYLDRARQAGGRVICRTEGTPELNESAVIVPGLTAFDDVVEVRPLPTNCKNGFERFGVTQGLENNYPPVPGIRQDDARSGILDISETALLLSPLDGATDDLRVANYRLGLDYEFPNGIILEANTGYIDYKRASMYDNGNSPILTNWQQRGEIYDMTSQELRFRSPQDRKVQWSAGLFWQDESLDLGNMDDPRYTTQTVRANIRRPVRLNDNYQDTTWVSAFASVTFNFMDDKASLDIGGRYTDIDKFSQNVGFARTWIFDINPDPDGDGVVPATDPTGRVRDVGEDMIDCATGNEQCGSYGAGYWTHAWRVRDIPDIWNLQAPLDAGAVVFGIRNNNGPYTRDYQDDSFDPQVTFRYRPNENHSLYAKYARAFKGGGANISTGSLPDSQEEFEIAPETAENYEIGAKGVLADGAARYAVTLFSITVDDLQIATNTPSDLGGGSTSTNAGKQRTQGLEVDVQWAASDRLLVGLTGALLDGEMVSYRFAGCNDFEFENAETGPCRTEDESIAEFGTGDAEGTIDRSGADAPRTPEWKFVADLDYSIPLANDYKFTINSKTTFSDGYIVNVEDFDEIIKYDDRVIANLALAFGPADNTWSVALWGRNLFEDGIQYFPEFDVELPGLQDVEVGVRNYRTYGVQFTYRMQ
jgi:outer membrane receptor protein involved in Fe transport